VIISDQAALTIDLRWRQGASLESAALFGTSAAPVIGLAGRRDAEQERPVIEAALAQAKGRVSGPFGAADKLGMPPSTLESKIKALQIDKRRFKPLPLVRNHNDVSRSFCEAS
jgi:DNA-binding NtrC family response regulator